MMRTAVLLILLLVPTVSFAHSKPKQVKIKIPVHILGPMGEVIRTEWREAWVDARIAKPLAKALAKKALAQSKLAQSKLNPPKNSVPFQFNGQTYYYQLARNGKVQGK